jgi:ubiquinone/menaquinone biosynthesis C-methylase UbiE
MSQTHRHFIPAAGRDFLLPLYDPLCRLIGAERARARLLAVAALQPGQRVLDLGCGTGALSLAIAQRHPGVALVALDPDAKALARARAKAERQGLAIDWREGFGDAIPAPDASFDRVLSSLVIHHLTRDEKRATFADVRRVLAPGGRLHLLDFGPPRNGLERALTALFHRDERVRDNLRGELPVLMGEAGLAEAREAESLLTPFGRVAIVEARRA